MGLGRESDRDNSSLDCDEDGFRTVANVQFLRDMVQMISYGELTYLKCVGYLFIGEALCDQFEDLTLSTT